MKRVDINRKSGTKLWPTVNNTEAWIYRAFQRFGQAKFPDGGSVLGSSQFSMLPYLIPKVLFY